MASLLAPDAAGLALAGERLRAGGLVSFPTETVYGLGAHALDERAVLSIFAAKGRPLTDPLIVHVREAADAAPLLDLDAETRALFAQLAEAFWPGPLTLVGRASAAVPPAVCAHSGFVGTRCPGHPVALALLEAAGVPVAAPSANRFGHVSPTLAAHVLGDLGAVDGLLVLENGGQSCRVGIESTVAKIDSERRELLVYRRGGVSEAALRRALDASEVGRGYSIRALTKAVRDPSPSAASATSVSAEEEEEEEEPQEAPGQNVTHYAPDVPTFLASSGGEEGGVQVAVRTAVVIDFGGALARLRDGALAYRDLSPAGDMAEAAAELFGALRWTETVEGAESVLLVDVSGDTGEHALAVHDRMFRAASGRRGFCSV